MMGKMKFGFVNDYGIFLHDTPHKELFAKSKRSLSLGCIRVERPQQLAEWLFGHEPPVPGDDAEQNVRIGEGVPIYVSYLTARPDGREDCVRRGRLQARRRRNRGPASRHRIRKTLKLSAGQSPRR